MSQAIVDHPEGFSLDRADKRWIAWTIYVGFFALFLGVTNGLGQALNYAHVDILKYFPGMRTYYQGLTAHGVLNALVLTFAFSNGFVTLTISRGLALPPVRALVVASLATLVAGVAIAGFAMFTGRANVLFTFYPPLQAHWTFYLGAALLVVSTWITSANVFVLLARWRRENRGRRVPLMAFMSFCTYAMWDLASVGLAVEVVVFLLPWSLGLLSGSDALLSRSLFWFSGHAIVYFWLLPIYISWYGMVPRQAGGKLLSDSLVRVAFLMFLCLSIPIGFHHQFVDPGIGEHMKFFHTILTFGVFFPSLITAFSVMYALEIGARRAGGKGLVVWFAKIPWHDPVITAQVLAMLTFVLGGITGLMNASFTINQVVHNTAFIPGHFHMTVGSAVALSMMGIAYWLVPYLEDRELRFAPLARAQAWIYTIGVLIFARGMISGGLDGMPRRTMMLQAPYSKPSWWLAGVLTGVGGTLMFVGSILFFVVLVATIVRGRRQPAGDVPFTVTHHAPAESGWEVHLDRFPVWVALAVTLILISYGPFFATYLPPKLLPRAYTFF